MPLSEGLAERVRRDGWAVVEERMSAEAFRAGVEAMGAVLASETIALRPGAHAYVAKPGPVPLHTDHPGVAMVGWWCGVQDAEDGASMLLDTRPVLDGLSAPERAVLREVELVCPPLAGGPPTRRHPVLSPSDGGDRLFCSPWLRSANDLAEHQAALDAFRTRLSAHAEAHRRFVRLAPGQSLFIDNTRMLHGRRAIAADSPRRLLRLWIGG